MAIIYDKESETFYEQRIIDNQTIELGMNLTDWNDNRRRDAYYRFLSSLGYDWGTTLELKKCIQKVYKIENVNPEVFDNVNNK